MDNTEPAKWKWNLRQIINSIVLAGIIILFIGAYYCVIKAGIPYQDPPLELQIQYAINMGIGETLVRDGFLILTGGGMAHLIFKFVLRER